jgi:hypothetical protein
MEISEAEFDDLVQYILRVELLSGKVLIYPISTKTKQYLINRLRANSESVDDIEPILLLSFETSMDRMVIINVEEIAGITFCFDYSNGLEKPNAYHDNFELLEKDTLIEEKQTKEGEVRLQVLEDEYLPQAIIFHKGKAPDDAYNDNPLTYSELEEGCLKWVLKWNLKENGRCASLLTLLMMTEKRLSYRLNKSS